MKKTILVCDNCGAENATSTRISDGNFDGFHYDEESLDLCSDCNSKLVTKFSIAAPSNECVKLAREFTKFRRGIK